MTLIIGLYMDRFSAPEWLWGVMSVLVALLWFGVYYYRKDCDTVDLFDVSLREKVENSGLKKSKFQQRLDKMAEERASNNEETS